MEAKQKKQMDLLTAIEQIVEKAKDSKLSPEFYRKRPRTRNSAQSSIARPHDILNMCQTSLI